MKDKKWNDESIYSPPCFYIDFIFSQQQQRLTLVCANHKRFDAKKKENKVSRRVRHFRLTQKTIFQKKRRRWV